MQKKWQIPTRNQIKLIPSVLSPFEKILFIVFFLVFLVSGAGLLITIDRNYTTKAPDNGGILREGIVGSPHKVNPLLASSNVDKALVNLLYSGLMREDGNGGLDNEMAESFTISEDALTYTFFLKEDLYWHEDTTLGLKSQKVTADDIVFTITMLKNPDINSPLRANWEGVEAEKIDERTVRFTLKRPYAPFLKNTTLGILPKYRWEGITPDEFTLSDMNIAPLGSGPYKLKSLKKDARDGIIGYNLKAFKKYQPVRAFISTINLSFYSNESELIAAYSKGDLDALSLSPASVSELGIDTQYYNVFRIKQPIIFAVFLNKTNSKILEDINVRTALELATDRKEIVERATNGYAFTESNPIFIAGIPEIDTGSSTQEEIDGILSESKWKRNEEGFFEKTSDNETQLLSIKLSTSDNKDLLNIANIIKDQWEKAGIKVDKEILPLNELEQNRIYPRDYEAIVFGQVVGFDPDPYAFWHSSQRNFPGYNISNYTNPEVDTLVEDIRNSQDELEKEQKYMELVGEIRKEIPAIFLFSPAYMYIASKDIKGIDLSRISLPGERFSNIEQWFIQTKNVWNAFLK